MSLRFADVLQVDDLLRESVVIDRWGGEVLIRSLRADERAELERDLLGKQVSPQQWREELLLRTLINDDGTPWVNREQLKQLMAKSAHAIEQLFEASAHLNAFSKQDVEDIEKN